MPDQSTTTPWRLRPPLSSSVLYTWMRTSCAATLAHEASGAARDLQMFAVGEVAHLVLLKASQLLRKDLAVTLADIEPELRATALRCAAEMPRWNNQPKPPVGPRPALEGLKLAVDWLRDHEPPVGEPEIGMAVTEDLKTAAAYDGEYVDAQTGPYWRAIIDHTVFYDDFDETSGADFTVLRIDDYKTAWSDVNPLTLQRKGQAIVAEANARAQGRPIDRVTLRTLNLRRRQIYAETVEVDELELWRRELKGVLDIALEVSGSVEGLARPGASCLRCPYLGACLPAAQLLTTNNQAFGVGAAHMWPVVDKYHRNLRQGLQASLEDGPIELTNGGRLEHNLKITRTLAENFYEELWARWFSGSGDPEAAARSLIKRLGLTPTAVERLIRTFPHEERKTWYEWLRKRTRVAREPFGIKVVPPEDL